jgi:1-acyl-sn-glycerol-3-phosphate acyltransferase
MMTDHKRSSTNSLGAQIFLRVILAPWYLIVFLFRLLYRFQVENIEKLPTEGPYILCVKEPTLMGMFPSGYIVINTFLPLFFTQPPTPLVAYMRDQLFDRGYFNYAFKLRDRYRFSINIRPLTAHAAGKQALYLLEGLRCLRNDGVVIINPEGIPTWDGMPVPIGKALAWLGLHSGAPIYPAICTMGAHETWPSWQKLPSVQGHVGIRVGDPLRLSDSPLENTTDDDLVVATKEISDIYNQLSYGEEGVEGWVGPLYHNGNQIDEPPSLEISQELIPPNQWPYNPVSLSLFKRGVSLLLWRCPVCKINDALEHERPWFRQEKIKCLSCSTVWEFNRIVDHDFRMRVFEGASELIDLDMPLSKWYEVMKQDFKLKPISATEMECLEGEEVYLAIDNVPLKPHKPNQLFENWEELEAPKTQPRGEYLGAKRVAIGTGNLTMTNKRLHWKSLQREINFYWTSVFAVYNWEPNVMGLVYGRAQYDIPLANDIGLKWITHAGEILKSVAEQTGHEYTISPY